MKQLLIRTLEAVLGAAPQLRAGMRMRIAFGHPVAPGRKASGVRAARRAAVKRRNRRRSK